MCVFVSEETFSSRNSAKINNFESAFWKQIRFFWDLGISKVKHSQYFFKYTGKIEKNEGKSGIFTQNQFSTKFCFFSVKLKNDLRYLNFSIYNNK